MDRGFVEFWHIYGLISGLIQDENLIYFQGVKYLYNNDFDPHCVKKNGDSSESKHEMSS